MISHPLFTATEVDASKIPTSSGKRARCRLLSSRLKEKAIQFREHVHKARQWCLGQNHTKFCESYELTLAVTMSSGRRMRYPSSFCVRECDHRFRFWKNGVTKYSLDEACIPSEMGNGDEEMGDSESMVSQWTLYEASSTSSTDSIFDHQQLLEEEEIRAIKLPARRPLHIALEEFEKDNVTSKLKKIAPQYSEHHVFHPNWLLKSRFRAWNIPDSESDYEIEKIRKDVIFTSSYVYGDSDDDSDSDTGREDGTNEDISPNAGITEKTSNNAVLSEVDYNVHNKLVNASVGGAANKCGIPEAGIESMCEDHHNTANRTATSISRIEQRHIDIMAQEAKELDRELLLFVENMLEQDRKDKEAKECNDNAVVSEDLESSSISLISSVDTQRGVKSPFNHCKCQVNRFFGSIAGTGATADAQVEKSIETNLAEAENESSPTLVENISSLFTNTFSMKSVSA